jgi:anti-sigma regulatory factor (Ser/Thr protein kinase)
MTAIGTGPGAGSQFRHEALFYAGDEEFLAGTERFVREAVDNGEAVLVALGPVRSALLRRALSEAASHVTFVDMDELGRNPSRILPAWRRFVDEHAPAGRPVRGIGEPAWPGRDAAELSECRRHEALLNLAFSEARDFWLLCPYDVENLDEGVVRGAGCTHPHIAERGESRHSKSFLPPHQAPGPFDGALHAASVVPAELPFTIDSLSAVRLFIGAHARQAGLAGVRVAELVLAVNELATNSIRHADGCGQVRTWTEDGMLIYEVEDSGGIVPPLAGRVQPTPEQSGGRGLWIVNQVCDLVQIRSLPTGTSVRVRMRVSG